MVFESHHCHRVGSLVIGSALLMIISFQVAQAEERGYRHNEFREFNGHHDHDRFYPSRGQFVVVVPKGHRVVYFGKERYYFFGGVWYRPARGGFIVVAPPVGIVVPVLPAMSTTVMVGAVPYYYANDVYYTAAPGGYVVVAPPPGEAIPGPPPAGPPPSGPPMPGSPSPGSAYQSPPPPGLPPSGPVVEDKMFIYPRQGQNDKQQMVDRRQCHDWAVGQIGFDPNRPPAGMPEGQLTQKRFDYQRAMGACLDGRGYTVR